jgi:TolB-like protein/DNA-binding winged helix-turn-helix (wHTH) protein
MDTAVQDSVQAGDLTIDRGRFCVTRDGLAVPMPRLSFDLLVALVDVAPNVASIDYLMQRVWPGLVVAPETVSQRVKLLRQALGDSAELPHYIEVVRGRGYRFSVPIDALPATLQQPAAVPVAPTVVPRRDRPGFGATLLLLPVLASMATVAWLLSGRDSTRDAAAAADDGASAVALVDGERVQARTTIAVLPFASFSSSVDDAALADGLHDDLLTRLAQLPALRVIARTSVEQFRGSRRDAREIGRQLGAGSLLEGSVQREAQRLRVNLQLIDARTQEHLWAQRLDRELTADNLFEVQDEIVAAVATALSTRLAAVPDERAAQRPTDSFAAWEAYQRGRQQMAARNTTGVDGARLAFEQAIELDPRFAEAHAALTQAHILRLGGSNAERQSALALAGASARQALELRPDLADAHVAIASVAEERHEFEVAERAYRRAIELNPNHALAHHWYSGLLAMLGRPVEGLHHAQQAALLDPLGIAVNVNLGGAYARLGRFADADGQYRKVLEIDPRNANAHWQIGELYARGYGRLDAGVPWERRSMQLDPGFAIPVRRLAIVQLDLGNDAEARRLLDVAHAARAPWVDTVSAMYHESRGERRAAVQHAGRVVATDDADSWRNSLSLAVLRNADLEAGRPEAALARYRRWRPELFAGSPPLVDARNLDAAISVAHLLQLTGDTSRAQAILAAAGAFLTPFSVVGSEGTGLARVRVLTLEGRRGEALRELEQAVEAGWRGPYWRYARDRDPELAALRNDPRFQAAFARVAQDLRAQRSRLAARPADAGLPLLPETGRQMASSAGK